MTLPNKIIETVKIAVGTAFAVFAVWGIDVGGLTEGVVLQLIDIIALILAALLGGSAASRVRQGNNQGFRPYIKRG